LLIGPDRAGELLEVLITAEGHQLVRDPRNAIRDEYRTLLGL
jgi:hypothetical protein